MSAEAMRGMDYAPPYIEHAARHNPDPRIRFHVGDAGALPFPDRRSTASSPCSCCTSLRARSRRWRRCAESRDPARPWPRRCGTRVAALSPTGCSTIRRPCSTPPAKRRARNFTRPMTRPGELAAAWLAAGLRRRGRDDLEHPHGVRLVRRLLDALPRQGRSQAEYVATLSDAERERPPRGRALAYLDGEPDGPRSYVAVAWAVKGIAPG